MKDEYIYLLIFILCLICETSLQLYDLYGYLGIIIPVGLIQLISVYEYLKHREQK